MSGISNVIENKKILLTGATGGIGSALLARMASGRGNVICISGTKQDKLEALAASYPTIAVHPIACDLRQVGEAESLPVKANQLMSGLDCVVCNAGITKDSLSMRMKLADWEEVITVNLTASFFINRSACKLMLRNKSAGSVVNISSVVGLTGNAGQANYVASKAGLVGMSKSLALEFAAKAIRINCVAPGFIDTHMIDAVSPEHKQAIVDRIPMKRIAKPEEVCGAVLWLLSDDAGYVTGQTISVNGGMLM